MICFNLATQSWAHQLPAASKLCGLMIASVLIYTQVNFIWLAAWLCIVISLYATLGKAGINFGMRMLAPLVWIIGILFFYHGLSGQWREGIQIVMKMLTLIGLANFVTMTTPLSEMMRLIDRILQPLRRFGVNPMALAIIFALTLRFIPILIEKSQFIIQSWQARSPRRIGWRIIFPLFLCALDDAQNVAEALRMRGGIINK